MDTVVAEEGMNVQQVEPQGDSVSDNQNSSLGAKCEQDNGGSEGFALPESGTSKYLRLGDIIAHPDNARKVYPKLSEPSEQELRASLLKEGLIHPIIVVKLPSGFGALAGERRRRNLYNLVSKGMLTLDQKIPVLERETDDHGNRTSHAENINRLPMKEWETYEHIAQRFKNGESVEEIGKAMGRPVKNIQWLLRLGKLHRSVFSALKKGAISVEVAQAYALTDNTKKQKVAWDSLGADANVHMVRKAVREGSIDCTSALARFVTVDAYKQAGGAVTEELFDDKVALHDIDLLNKLAMEKLESAAEILGEGWGWMEIGLPENIPCEFRYGFVENIRSKVAKVPKEIKQQHKELTARLSTLDEWLDRCYDDGDQYSREDEQKKEVEKSEIEAELEKLDTLVLSNYTTFDKKGMPIAGCVVSFNREGALEIKAGVLKDAKAVRKYADICNGVKAGKPDDTSGSAGDNGKEKGTGRSAAFARDLGMYVRAATRTGIAQDPALARDLLDFHILSITIKGSDRYRSGFLSLAGARVSDERERPEGDVCDAEKLMESLLSELPTDWVDEDDDSKRFELFKALSDQDREKLMAWVVATRYDTSLNPVHGDSLPSGISALLKVDHAKLWRPTAETYFNRCDLSTLIAHGVEWYGEKFASDVEAMKGARKKILAQRFSALFEGDDSVLTDKEKKIRRSWLPAEFQS